MRAMIGRWIDKVFGSHIAKLDQLERDLYDCKVKATKLENENFKLRTNEMCYDDDVRRLTSELTSTKGMLEAVCKENAAYVKQIKQLENVAIYYQDRVLMFERRKFGDELTCPQYLRYKPGQLIVMCSANKDGDMK